ncbi:DUF192 domain-containing protein [Candidatus Omnitrophota bacterium]
MGDVGYIRHNMKTVKIVNVTKKTILAQEGKIAASLGQRMKGLLGRDGLAADQALVLKPCTSIHTCFMRFTIDVLFVDSKMKVIKLIQNIPPFRLSSIAWRSQMAIELPAGKIAQTNTQSGDLIQIT